MKKLLGITVLIFFWTVNAYSIIGDTYNSSNNLVEIDVGGGPPHQAIDKPSFKKKAIKHCSKLKKKTYYIYQEGLWEGFPSKFNPNIRWPVWQYHSKSGVATVKFFCANSSDEAITLAKSSVWEGGHKKKQKKVKINFIEYPIELSKKQLKIVKKKRQEKKEKEKLTLKFGPDCEADNLVKGTSGYNDCLNNKIKIELDRQKVLAKKLAAMTPTERHAYNCSETFKFKKGTEKFNDCVFKLYTAELDLQKLELEKEVAETKIKAAATEQARAEAVANAQIAAAKSAKRSSDLNNSIQLMKLGSSLLGGSTSTSSSSNSFDINNRTRTTCRVVGGFLNCY